jgi:predicted RecA/RadA family phage recombinase
MKNFIQPGDVVIVTAPTGGVPSGDGIVIGNLFGICATDADQAEEVELSLTGVLGQWPDGRAREGLVEHHGCQGQERYGCRALPDGTAVKAAGTSDTTVRVPFDGVAVVAAGL